jgi:hypothetical protein
MFDDSRLLSFAVGIRRELRRAEAQDSAVA